MVKDSISDRDDDLSFPGKLAVITTPAAQNPGDDEFNSVKPLVAKYGKDKIMHVFWPLNHMTEKQGVRDTVVGLASDREIKALIINQAVPGTNNALYEFKKIRKDVFIVCCNIHESPSEAAKRANLLLEIDALGLGPVMVKQAKKQGAKTFVHYSFPRHMSVLLYDNRRTLIKEACAAEGMQFVDATALDPVGEAGLEAARQFMLDDVPKMAAKYGEDTAFFCTNCHVQAPLIKAVIKCHAIYPQPCCPSPFHGFPEALGIKTGNELLDLNYLITEASRIAAEKNMSDRLSTWPVSTPMMFTNVGAEYAIRRARGEVSGSAVNDEVLEDCINNYINDAIGEGVEVVMTPYTENGKTYNNFKLVLMSYLDF